MTAQPALRAAEVSDSDDAQGSASPAFDSPLLAGDSSGELANESATTWPGLANWFDLSERPGWMPRVYGWLEQGYSYANSGNGRLAVAPQMNRFGNEYLVNQLALTFDRPCDKSEFSCGYYAQLLSGADATTLQGPGDIRNTNARFGLVVRQARVQTHLPVFCDGGIDIVVGRQGSPMGYESYMAPLRPFYSLSYQWFYAEDGADTGCWTTFHLNKRCDVMLGGTLGSNTFFSLRAHHGCELAQIRYWLDDDHRWYWCATLINGDQAVGKNFIAYPGTLQTVLEWRTQFDVTERLSQVLQANLGWDEMTQVAHVGRWAGVLGNSVYHCTSAWDAQGRLEWFDDTNGARTGVATNYVAITGGFAGHWGEHLLIRPELRGDVAGRPVFGQLDSLSRRRQQLTVALDCVLTF